MLVLVVNRLRRLVLSPPTPTAGTLPFSVPSPVCVANWLKMDDVSVAVAVLAGAVKLPVVEVAASVGTTVFAGDVTLAVTDVV